MQLSYHMFHTDAFTHRQSYTQVFYTQMLLHRVLLTHRCFYTQMLLHTNLLRAHTHKHFCTQTPVHTTPLHFCTNTFFTHRRLYTQTFFHTPKLLHADFFTQTLYTEMRKIAIVPQFLATDPHLVRKGRAQKSKSKFYSSFWWSTVISCDRVARGGPFYLSF